jgi:hypothetical protein
MYEDTTINAPCAVKIERIGKKNVMLIYETNFLREATSKMDRFPEYVDNSFVKEKSGIRRFLVMQFIDKSLDEYVTEKYRSYGDLVFFNLAQ